MDKEKKKSIGVYIGLVICFILFSIFVFSKKDSNNTENTINKKIESNIIESDNNDKNTSSTKISDEENIQNESEKVVEEFLNSYHKISSLEPQKEFKNAENLVEEELYKELEIEVIGNASMPTNGYIYRTMIEQRADMGSIDPKQPPFLSFSLRLMFFPAGKNTQPVFI